VGEGHSSNILLVHSHWLLKLIMDSLHMNLVFNVGNNICASAHTCPFLALDCPGGLFNPFDTHVISSPYKEGMLALGWQIFYNKEIFLRR